MAARELVLPLVRLLRRETRLGVSVCLGTLAPSITRELLSAGAGIYIIKFEVSDPVLYRALEAPGTLEERAGHIRWLASEGLPDALRLRVVGRDATPMRGRDGTDTSYDTDTLNIGPGESYDALFTAYRDGYRSQFDHWRSLHQARHTHP